MRIQHLAEATIPADTPLFHSIELEPVLAEKISTDDQTITTAAALQ